MFSGTRKTDEQARALIQKHNPLEQMEGCPPINKTCLCPKKLVLFRLHRDTRKDVGLVRDASGAEGMFESYKVELEEKR